MADPQQQRRRALVERHRQVLETVRRQMQMPGVMPINMRTGQTRRPNGSARRQGGPSFGTEAALQGLRQVSAESLKSGVRSKGFIRGTLIEDPIHMQSVASLFECGGSREVHVVAFADECLEACGGDPAATFRRGASLCILRPLLKPARDGTPAIRVEQAADVVFVSEAPAADSNPAPSSSSSSSALPKGGSAAARALRRAEAAVSAGLAPLSAEAANESGHAALKAERLAEAAAHYKAAAGLDPRAAKYPSNRACALLKMGLHKEALEAAHDATRLDPRWAKPAVRKGEALFGLGRYGEALAEFERALGIQGAKACDDPKAVGARADACRAALAAQGRAPASSEAASARRIEDESGELEPLDPSDPACAAAIAAASDEQRRLVAVFHQHARTVALTLNLARTARGRRRAAEMLRAPAEAGLAYAQCELGRMLTEPAPDGCGELPLDPPAAVAWFKRAATQPAWLLDGRLPNAGVVDACIALAACCRDGVGVPEAERATCLDWCRRGAEGGTRDASQARALNGVGELLLGGQGGRTDAAEARRWFQRAVDEFRFSAAQFNLGLCYLNGEGGEVDLAKARALLEAAAEQGHAQAARALASLPGDASRTFENLKRAAEGGDRAARVELSLAYLYGRDGAPRRSREALRLLEGLAEEGDADAMCNAGVLLWSGSPAGGEDGPLEPDPRRAAAWFTRAATRGHVTAALHLATMYGAGSGAPKDAKLARQWARAAGKRLAGGGAAGAGAVEERLRAFETRHGAAGAGASLADRLERMVLTQVEAGDWSKPPPPPAEPASVPHDATPVDHFATDRLLPLAQAGSAVAQRLLAARREWETGLALWFTGRLDEGLPRMSSALARECNVVVVPQPLERALLADIRRHAESNPNDVDAAVCLCTLDSRGRSPALSAAMLRRAAALAPDDWAPRSMLANFLVYDQQFAAAAEELRRAAALLAGPSAAADAAHRVPILYLLGNCEARVPATRAAGLRKLEEYVAASSPEEREHAEAHFQLAFHAESEGRAADAVAWYERGLAAEGGVLPPFRAAGLCESRAKAHVEAALPRLRGRLQAGPEAGAPERCAACGAGGPLRACGRCRGVAYCGAECQRADWPRHKPSCRGT